VSDTEERLAPDVTPTTDRRGQSAAERREARNRRDRERRAREKAGGTRRGPGRPKGSKNRTSTPAKNRSLEGPIRETLYAIGGVWGTTEAFRDHPEPTCGEVLQDQAGAIAKTLNAVAQDDPSVYLWLDRMMTGGGWGAVVFAVLPVAQAFAGNHVIPAIQRRAGARMAGPWEPEEPSPAVEVMPAWEPEPTSAPESEPDLPASGADTEPGPEQPNEPAPPSDFRPDRETR